MILAPVPVSAIVMTKNEAPNIEKCLRSLAAIDQIVVVDSGSRDGTQQLARDLGATVVSFCWNGQYPKKKQWCLENINFEHDWIIYVDADEEATPALIDEIRRVVCNPVDTAGYFVGYNYTFLGKTLRYGVRVFKLVLFDRHRGSFEPYDDLDATNMWEVEGHYQPVIDGPVKTLSNAMLHTDHDSLYHYFARHNRYSDWEAVVRTNRDLVSQKETQISGRDKQKALFDRMPLKGLVAFLYSYVIRRGFLDGNAGLHFALSKAFYYWQIEIKVSEVQRMNRTPSQGVED